MCFHQRAVNNKQTNKQPAHWTKFLLNIWMETNFIFPLTRMMGSEMIRVGNDYLIAPGLLFNILVLSWTAWPVNISQDELGEAVFLRCKTFLHLQKCPFCPFTQGLLRSATSPLQVEGLGGHQWLHVTIVRTDAGKRRLERSNRSCEC